MGGRRPGTPANGTEDDRWRRSDNVQEQVDIGLYLRGYLFLRHIIN